MFILVWDYFGDDAKPTAEHQIKHLKDFCKKEGIERAETELDFDDELMGWCAILKLFHRETALKVANSLKPERAFEAKPE